MYKLFPVPGLVRYLEWVYIIPPFQDTHLPGTRRKKKKKKKVQWRVNPVEQTICWVRSYKSKSVHLVHKIRT